MKDAIEDGRVLDYNEKRRDDLSVIAKPTRLGNITKSSLEKSIAQFRKKVNAFKEKIKFLIPTAPPAPSPTAHSSPKHLKALSLRRISA